MKILLSILFLFSLTTAHGQETQTLSPSWQKHLDETTNNIYRVAKLTETKATWIPELSVAQRFNGYSFRSRGGSSFRTMGATITTIDLKFFRYWGGFAGFRTYIQAPLQTSTVLQGTYIGFGGYGGGYVLDTRRRTDRGVQGSTLSIIGEGYSMWDKDNSNNRIMGGGPSIRFTHNFYEFLGISVGFNTSFGSIREFGSSAFFVSYGGSIGLTF